MEKFYYKQKFKFIVLINIIFFQYSVWSENNKKKILEIKFLLFSYHKKRKTCKEIFYTSDCIEIPADLETIKFEEQLGTRI